jgi:hypothetical protein
LIIQEEKAATIAEAMGIIKADNRKRQWSSR